MSAREPSWSASPDGQAHGLGGYRGQVGLRLPCPTSRSLVGEMVVGSVCVCVFLFSSQASQHTLIQDELDGNNGGKSGVALGCFFS